METVHDQFSKTLADEDPRGFLLLAEALALDAEADVQPLDRELVRDPTRIDKGFAIHQAGRKPWISLVESFSSMKPGDWDRVYWYSHDLLGMTRLVVRPTVLLMFEDGCPREIPEVIRVKVEDFEGTIRVRTVKLWEVPAEKLIDTGRPRLMSWVPLTKASSEQMRETLRRLERDSDERPRNGFRLAGELRYGKSAWLEFLGRKEFEMFPIPMIMERSERFRDYVDEIVQKASAEATAKATAEATAITTLSVERAMLRKIVAVKFPSVLPLLPSDEALRDSAAIQTLVDAVLAATTPEEAAGLFRLPS